MPAPFLIPLLLATTAISVVQQHKAVKESKKASQREQRIQDIKSARARIKAVREARIRRAEIAQSAEATGVAGGAGAIGAQASVQQQLGAEVSFLERVGSLAKESSIFRQRAVKARGTAGIAQSIGAVASAFIKPEDVESFF